MTTIFGADDRLVLTDGGIETHMIFILGRELNNFALFEALLDEDGLAKLEAMYVSYIEVAKNCGCSLLMGSPTWRANMNHMKGMGYEESEHEVERINKLGASWMCTLRDRVQSELSPGKTFVVGGDVGPAGDGYVIENALTAESAACYHRPNIAGLKAGGAEVIQAVTMTYPAEAIGIVLAARDAELPVVVLFTVETNGVLPNGSSLEDAILATDSFTDGYASYYGVNCAHPCHIRPALEALSPDVLARVKEVRVNASRKSHAELDEATELDFGHPEELGSEVAELVSSFGLRVVGGCCGCDDRHIRCIAESCNGVPDPVVMGQNEGEE